MKPSLFSIAAAVFAVTLLLAHASYADTPVRVLILDEGFQKVPGDRENLIKFDSIKGNLTLGGSKYSGNFEIWKGLKGLYLINMIPLEEYVAGVVQAETAKGWAPEALKAQAVITRTYVLNRMILHRDREFHVTSSVDSQVYKGRSANSGVKHAVAETSGQILAYDNAPIIAYYHSSSSGTTELPEEVFGSSYPYLKSVSSSGRLSPYNIWTRRIPLEEIEKASGTHNLIRIKVKSTTLTGRAKDIALFSPTQGPIFKNTTIEAKHLRRALGWKRLPSTDFTVRTEGRIAVFEGKGYGHGVGLSQWTSQEMALEGMDYMEILHHFYPGAQLVNHENL